MIHLLIGLLAATGFFLLFSHATKHSWQLKGWHWVFTVLIVAYLVFSVEAIYSLLAEGAGNAAIVTAIVLGLPAAIAIALLIRYVFQPAGTRRQSA